LLKNQTFEYTVKPLPYVCSAIGTPLDAKEGLHVLGLRAHLDDQAQAGIDGVLVGGTMGACRC
jgi:dihydrodipicolinate synthase/N-acetylneuraminate lyase